MRDAVVTLKVVPKGYNSQVIEHLERLLAQARSGEVFELTAITKLKSGEYESSWTGCENLVELAGHLERLKLQMLRRMDT